MRCGTSGLRGSGAALRQMSPRGSDRPCRNLGRQTQKRVRRPCTPGFQARNCEAQHAFFWQVAGLCQKNIASQGSMFAFCKLCGWASKFENQASMFLSRQNFSFFGVSSGLRENGAKPSEMALQLRSPNQKKLFRKSPGGQP